MVRRMHGGGLCLAAAAMIAQAHALRCASICPGSVTATRPYSSPCSAARRGPFMQMSSTTPPVVVGEEQKQARPLPGEAAKDDEAQFRANPQQFCRERMDRHGEVFASGVFGNCVMVGGPEAEKDLAAADSNVDFECGVLGRPFALDSAGSAGSTYAHICDAFNQELYSGIFNWIPVYKEAGGFGTFKFDDFLDRRVRRVTPSLRRLLFRALARAARASPRAPSLLGCPLSALPPLSEKAEAAEWEKAYAAFGASVSRGKSAGSLPFGFGLLVGGSGPPPDALTTALSRALSSGGGSPLLNGLAYKAAAGDTEADAAAVAAVVAAAIEPTAALVGAMLVRAQVSSSEWGAKLSSEQKTALAGVAPDAAISAEALSAMPKLDEFAKEVLRTAPPTRPPALRLKAPAVIGGVSVPQGALVMRESYLSNFLGDVYSQPLAFEPERFSAERREPFPLGFACERGESSAEAEQLLLDVAKATFVQIRRMFSVKLSVDVPEASGFPVRALPDEYEMLVEAGMFYELKRETKRLNF